MEKELDPLLDDLNYAEEADPRLIRRLRYAAAPKGQRGLWLKHMSDSQLVETFYRLDAGLSPHMVAKIAQQEWGMMPKSEVKSLARGVKAFKERTLSAVSKVAPHTDDKTFKQIESKIEKIEAQVDGLQTYAWSILRMQERIQVLLEKEGKSMPLKITNRCFEILGNLLDRYIKWQVELGTLPCAPNEFNLNVSHKFAGVLAHTVGQDVDKITQATERFMQEIDKRSLSLRMDQTGTYRFQEKESNQIESAECNYTNYTD